MNKPNLFIPGFPKSGTSSLHSILCQHPLIAGGISKEPHTYSSIERYQERKASQGSHSFNKIYCEKNHFILDSSTSYLISPDAITRILEDTPNAKFIIIARDPIERIFSHFKWLQSKGVRVQSLRQELNIEPKRWDFNANINGKFKFFWQYTRYGTQIKRLEDIVGRESYHFLFYEQFIFDPIKEVSKIIQFLNIENFKFEMVRVNITGHGVIVPDSVRKLAKFAPKGFRAFFKKKLSEAQFKEPQLIDLEIIKPDLIKEINILESLGINTDKWKMTHDFTRKDNCVINPDDFREYI